METGIPCVIEEYNFDVTVVIPHCWKAETALSTRASQP